MVGMATLLKRRAQYIEKAGHTGKAGQKQE